MKKLYRTKKPILMMLLLVLALGISACGTASTPATTAATTTAMATTTAAETTMAGETTAAETMAGEQTFNKEELAKFNGKDGQPAYVAVDGVVYDVTNFPLWKNGEHNGMVAGIDQTEGIKKSPHGTPIFDKKSVPVVGKYVE